MFGATAHFFRIAACLYIHVIMSSSPGWWPIAWPIEGKFCENDKEGFRIRPIGRTEAYWVFFFFLCVKCLGDNTALQKAFSSVTSTRLCDHAINVTLERDRAMATNKLQNTNDKHRRRAQYLHKFFSSLPLSFAASVCVTRFFLRTLFAEEDIDVLTAKTLDSRTSQHKHKVSTYIFCFSYLLYLFWEHDSFQLLSNNRSTQLDCVIRWTYFFLCFQFISFV